MKNKLTKEELMKNLDIQSFSELTKEKVLKIETLLNDLDSVTAKSILEEFPDFTKVMEEILKKYKAVALDKISDDKRFAPFCDTFNSVADKIQDKLVKGNLSFDEKNYVIDCMLKIVRVTDNGNKNDRLFVSIMAVLKAIAMDTLSSELLYYVYKV